MRRAYKFRMRPTERQHVALAASVASHRELYNAALQERRDAWAHSKTRIRYGDQSAQLSDIRSVRPDAAVWSFSSQQATLRRLNRAFERARVYLQGIGQVKVTMHRRVAGRVKTIQIHREGRRRMLILSCDEVPENLLPATGRRAGVDVGIASFVTTSDGARVDNPRWARTAADTLAGAQRRLARAQRGSKNRGRRRETLAARHRKIANCRRDFHHKTARRLVDCYDVIAVEDLAIANMCRRAKPVPDPDVAGGFRPNGAAAKTGLNLSISDAGWGQFLSILRAKAEDAGRIWIAVDPRHTSDGCERCGYAAKENRLTQAVFTCRRCGHTAHADEHAARNILRAGLAHHAHAA
ncbi:MAG: RNA-guided endonuclease InsQ/TnpB family protein [Mycobacterium sp.]